MLKSIINGFKSIANGFKFLTFRNNVKELKDRIAGYCMDERISD